MHISFLLLSVHRYKQVSAPCSPVSWDWVLWMFMSSCPPTALLDWCFWTLYQHLEDTDYLFALCCLWWLHFSCDPSLMSCLSERTGPSFCAAVIVQGLCQEIHLALITEPSQCIWPCCTSCRTAVIPLWWLWVRAGLQRHLPEVQNLLYFLPNSFQL